MYGPEAPLRNSMYVLLLTGAHVGLRLVPCRREPDMCGEGLKVVSIKVCIGIFFNSASGPEIGLPGWILLASA